MSEHIRTQVANRIMTIVIDRQDKRNALTDAMYGALADSIERAQSDPDVRVVVLRSEGDIFTAGNDLGDFAAARPGHGPRNVSRFLQAAAQAAKPLLAAVQGRAVGVGTTILLHCDYVVLAEDAVLSTPFVSLGLVPEAASSLLLPAMVGHLRAFAMLGMGDAVAAADALTWGLANAVVPRGELTATVEATAARLAASPIGSLIETKALMRPMNAITAQMDAEGEKFARRLVSEEAREAFAAFAERRPPDFSRFA